jgi:hypothetical protein
MRAIERVDVRPEPSACRAALASTGRAGLALGLLQQGWTVRQLLRQFYGIDSGPLWDDAAECRAFRRTLQRSNEGVN